MPDTVNVISAVCTQLGERALICTGLNECTGVRCSTTSRLWIR